MDRKTSLGTPLYLTSVLSSFFYKERKFSLRIRKLGSETRLPESRSWCCYLLEMRLSTFLQNIQGFPRSAALATQLYWEKLISYRMLCEAHQDVCCDVPWGTSSWDKIFGVEFPWSYFRAAWSFRTRQKQGGGIDWVHVTVFLPLLYLSSENPVYRYTPTPETIWRLHTGVLWESTR